MEDLYMKKIAALCLPALLLALFLAGCESRPTESVVSRVYTYAASSEPVMKPTLVLEDDRFTLTLSPLDSYMPRGSYEIKNHTLLLKTDDGEQEYLFAIRGETLVFDATGSSALPSFADIPDGAVFQ